MFCRSITWFTCVFMAVVIASDYNDRGFITGFDREVTVDQLRTDSPELSTTTERAQKVEGSTAADLATLLDAGDGAVVTLVAGDTRLVAHRAVLAARSPVFQKMFQHNPLEASGGWVVIPDVEGPVLRHLLSYMYTLQAPQLPSVAPQVLAAADSYGLPHLKAAFEQQVAAQLSVENAVATALLALRHSCPVLKQAAVTFIKAHTLQVVMTQGWADAAVSHPHYVVELTRLIAEPPAQTSTAATTESRSAPITRSHGDYGQTAVTAPPHVATCHTPPTDDATVRRMRNLSREEKGRRLIEAAQEGKIKELRALLAVGTDVGAMDGDRRTALHWAAWEGHLEAARCLLEGGAEVAARNVRQNTPLHSAATAGHTAVVRLLVRSSADANAKNLWGWTPLHWAAYKGHLQVATVLLEFGANTEARDDEGNTPRQHARKNNHQRLVQLLT
ncbi:serine/threonine-protein phosphatase 6 regulatory ankyrin repeat subunit C-like isoform X2 [Schistocerca serialis cubense]|uniref:serine/threonine-protein phosphatase 6 regulatory ankyrin repeat subunit C-like isoform X2 n=1 Tax=Schistocerca serialis cubense TaxID=2023355 RepID=UPI00214E9F6A|nr:serine/threonine-protein phosphatase 6 regulatory ankyrin repeat subunit C-like isoform X2 [Schistocerca serialis cubense]